MCACKGDTKGVDATLFLEESWSILTKPMISGNILSEIGNAQAVAARLKKQMDAIT